MLIRIRAVKSEASYEDPWDWAIAAGRSAA